MFLYVHPEKAKKAPIQEDPTPERFYAFQRSMEAHAEIQENKEQHEKQSMRRETRENILRTFRENRALKKSGKLIFGTTNCKAMKFGWLQAETHV